MVKKVMQGFQRIKEKHKRKYQRGKRIKLIGVKSLECNFNPAKKTYTLHLHLIVANKKMAEILIQDWLKLWTPKFAQRQAQDMREIFNAEKQEVILTKEPQSVFNYEQWDFNPHRFDWQNTTTDEVLTGFKPKPQLSAILSNCIDITSQ